MGVESVLIGYLAPELPGPSSTFVYNEIFALQKLGFRIQPFSVHGVHDDFKDPKVVELQQISKVLYQESMTRRFFTLFPDNIRALIRNRKGYTRALGWVFRDLRTLIHQRKWKTALGLCFRFWVAARLCYYLSQKQVTHLHIHFAHIPTDIGMYASAMAGIGFSVTSHANDLFERGWLLREKIDRSAFFATISLFNKHFLKEQGITSNKVVIVRCGVNSLIFQPRASQPNNKTIKLGFLGRLVEKKGVEVLLNACHTLTQNERDGASDFCLDIVGNGPLQESLTAQAKRLDLTDKVRFLGGLDHSQVAGWLKDLDFFVLPCVKDQQGDMDGIPVALMEAIMAGVPVISTGLSGIPELILTSEGGLLASPSDPEDLARVIEQAMSLSIGERENIVNQAVTRVKSEFELQHNAERLGEYLASACGINHESSHSLQDT